MHQLVDENFAQELSLIVNDSIRKFTFKMLEMSPSYFWTKPSSSTGKYHPEQCQGIGGLVRHTKSVVYLANELCNTENLEGDERDAVLSACLLHDLCKYGLPEGKHTTPNHDYVGAFFLKAQATKLGLDETPMLKEILGGVAWHYGIWSKRFNGQAVKSYPADYTRVERLVHTADFVASRKELKFGFLEEPSFIG